MTFRNLCNFSDTESIVKIGEGTFGEAFIAGSSVCKIVPIDGELRVNGEIQKVLFEVISLIVTLSSLLIEVVHALVSEPVRSNSR